MDVFYAYTYSTAGWLSLQAIPLIGMPQMIVRIMLEEARQPSQIEIYFARCLGFSLLTIAILTIMLSGSIPLSSAVSEAVSTEDSDPKAPYAVPTLVITSVYHAISAFYAYTWYTTTDQVVFAAAMVGYFVVASIGLWCTLFASSHGKISRKTGADKRTTGFPLHNRVAERKHVEKSE
ncbi:GTPase npa3 [Aspergillus udagawae]|uniref:GTPase npa3 n=1 Tax=Aspergillus udagawae TaxID=91492 RepID=A0ABQ1A640_9EURO|nr:GTPase npa3 [Aspergillus udagawae]GFF74471.1 GTPase npa3 [Aspergillus udagawae]GFG01244.1 GTPase npa3 [Aspergillus udagawae]GFG22490.1 GTPase npa3 [Aspergillus udagawae]